MLRPYKRDDRQDAVQMVGHEDEFVEIDPGKMIRDQ